MIDYLIIGGGIAGVSAAAQLSAHGSVIVLETESSLAHHASGRSAAIFVPDYGNQVIRALSYGSLDVMKDMGVLRERTMMLLGRASETPEFNAEAKSLRMSRIGLGEAESLFPILNHDSCAFAALRHDVFDLDTDLAIQNYVKLARANGALFMTSTKLEALTRSSCHWTATTATQQIETKTVINAAGAWADQVAVMAGLAPIGLQPYRRSMAVMAPPGGHDVTNWPFVDGVGETWYAKPDAGNWLVSPSEEDPVAPHDAYADYMVIAEGLDRYQGMVTQQVSRPKYMWAGLRSFAPDRSLVIGRDPAASSFFWLAGQGGYGFQTAPSASRLAANLLTGAPPALPAQVIEQLSPSRFAP